MEHHRYISASLHRNGDHWALVFATLRSKKFIHYDPLKLSTFADGFLTTSNRSLARQPSPGVSLKWHSGT